MNKLILISLVIVFAICSKSWAVEFYPLPKESKAPEPETHIKEQLSFSANKILKEGKIIHKTFDDKLQRYNFFVLYKSYNFYCTTFVYGRDGTISCEQITDKGSYFWKRINE
jgi:ABC-type transport system involved in Fe-S cluster assembly fused permease/ATPase subunit